MKRSVLFMLALMPVCLFAQQMEYAGFLPMPVPQWKQASGLSAAGHHFIGYDVATHSVSVIDTVKHPVFRSSEFTEPFIPYGMETTEEMTGAKNFNDLSQVTNTSSYPWSAVVKLFMTFPSSAQFVGSGILINSRYILTAGHCVYSSAEGGWASSIQVVPGYYSGNSPFGSAWATNMYSWTGWTNSGDFNWDMAYVKLDSDIGTTTGYLGYGYNNDAFFQTNSFHNPGYPAESPYDGSLMYYWWGTYDQVLTKLLYFNKYCYGGQSGSGSYYKDGSNNRYVYAVLSHYNSIDGTGHVRITGDMFTSIQNQINGTRETNTQNEIKCSLFPVPATDQVHVCFAEMFKALEIQIFDVNGKVQTGVITTNNGSYAEIDIRNLPAGFYTVSITDGTNRAVKHFIKL